MKKLKAHAKKHLKNIAKTKHVSKKKRLTKMKVKQELQSTYYPLMKVATLAMLILLVTIGVILVYSLTTFYGFDISNQITSAAATNLSAP